MTSKVDLKVVVLGKEFVGKTALVERFLNDNFASINGYQPTIGAAYGARKMTNNEKIPIIMGIWDTAGSERYQSMTKMYYRGAKAAILCYDMTDAISLKRLDFWIKELQETERECMLFLCGCKKDLVSEVRSERAISDHVLNDLSRSLGAKLFETSSKTGSGIVELFQTICNDVSNSPDFLSNSTRNNIQLGKGANKKNENKCASCFEFS